MQDGMATRAVPAVLTVSRAVEAMTVAVSPSPPCRRAGQREAHGTDADRRAAPTRCAAVPPLRCAAVFPVSPLPSPVSCLGPVKWPLRILLQAWIHQHNHLRRARPAALRRALGGATNSCQPWRGARTPGPACPATAWDCNVVAKHGSPTAGSPAQPPPEHSSPIQGALCGLSSVAHSRHPHVAPWPGPGVNGWDSHSIVQRYSRRPGCVPSAQQ